MEAMEVEAVPEAGAARLGAPLEVLATLTYHQDYTENPKAMTTPAA